MLDGLGRGVVADVHIGGCGRRLPTGEHDAGLGRIRPGAAEGEHGFIGHPPHQQPVDAVVEGLVAVVVAGLVQGLQPVDAAIGAGDVTIEAGGDVVDQGGLHDQGS
ncbi:hypothetical protein D3C78_1489670 [compost metagenome]